MRALPEVGPADADGTNAPVEFWTAVRVLARRWYVFVPCLVVFLLIAAVLVANVKPTYDAEGSVVLLNVAQTNGQNGPINPFQSADYQANQFALIMEDVLTSERMRDTLAAQGVGRDYEITNSTNQTPVLFLAVHATSADGATAAYRALIEQLRKELDAQQAAVQAPTQTRYTPVDLTVPATPEPKVGSRVQVGLFVGIIGIALSIAITLVFESLVSARQGGLGALSPRRLADGEIDPGISGLRPEGDETAETAEVEETERVEGGDEGRPGPDRSRPGAPAAGPLPGGGSDVANGATPGSAGNGAPSGSTANGRPPSIFSVPPPADAPGSGPRDEADPTWLNDTGQLNLEEIAQVAAMGADEPGLVPLATATVLTVPALAGGAGDRGHDEPDHGTLVVPEPEPLRIRGVPNQYVPFAVAAAIIGSGLVLLLLLVGFIRLTSSEPETLGTGSGRAAAVDAVGTDPADSPAAAPGSVAPGTVPAASGTPGGTGSTTSVPGQTTTTAKGGAAHPAANGPTSPGASPSTPSTASPTTDAPEAIVKFVISPTTAQSPWSTQGGPTLQWTVADGLTARVSGPAGTISTAASGQVHPCPVAFVADECNAPGGRYSFELVAYRNGSEVVDRRTVYLTVSGGS
jgi:capsular polysaccharide biosynthesis protein